MVIELGINPAECSASSERTCTRIDQPLQSLDPLTAPACTATSPGLKHEIYLRKKIDPLTRSGPAVCHLIIAVGILIGSYMYSHARDSTYCSAQTLATTCELAKGAQISVPELGLHHTLMPYYYSRSLSSMISSGARHSQIFSIPSPACLAMFENSSGSRSRPLNKDSTTMSSCVTNLLAWP